MDIHEDIRDICEDIVDLWEEYRRKRDVRRILRVDRMKAKKEQ